MRQFKRARRRPKAINLGSRYLLFQKLAGTLFGATHAVVAAQCGRSDQSLHETQTATGLSRNTVDICLHDLSRAGLGRYASRLFSPCEDTVLEPVVNRLSRSDPLGRGKAEVKNGGALLARDGGQLHP